MKPYRTLENKVVFSKKEVKDTIELQEIHLLVECEDGRFSGLGPNNTTVKLELIYDKDKPVDKRSNPPKHMTTVVEACTHYESLCLADKTPETIK